MKSLKKNLHNLALFAALAVNAVAPAQAEDIDLFAGINPSVSDPTVLLVWDTAARTGASAQPVCEYSDAASGTTAAQPSLGNDTVAGMEQCAIVNALLSLKADPQLLGKLKIGLMIFNQKNEFPVTGGFSANGNGECGYLMFEPRLMDSDGVDALVSQVKGFQKSYLSNQSQTGDTIAEAWAMLNAKTTSCSTVDYSALAEAATQCRDAVILFIGNAFTNSNPVDGNIDADAVDGLLKTELTEFGYGTSSDEYQLFSEPIAVSLLNTSGNDNNKFWADEWTRFMKRVNVDDSAKNDDGSPKISNNVTTYAISVTDFANQDQAQSVINYYAMMAKQGAGKSFLVDVDDWSGLKEALLDVFNEVQAVNSVFSSATLPVSANTQGTFLNQVYIAMFRPDSQARPRWLGNLKQFRLGFDSGGNLVLTDSKPENDPVDANGEPRVVESVTNPVTGTVAPDALSFWTTNSPGVTDWPADGFWISAPSGEGFAKDAPDGDLVEKGGAHQMLRVDNLTDTYDDTSTNNSRQLLTCNSVGSCSTTLAEFSTGNSTLMTNASSLFGISPVSSDAQLTAGSSATLTTTIACTKTPAECTMSFANDDDGGLGFEAGDGVILSESAFNCPGSAPCEVLSVTSTSVVFENTQSGTPSSIKDTTILVTRAVNQVNVAFTGHGFVETEIFNLASCTTSANDQLPTTSTKQLESVASVIDDNNFTFLLDSPVFISSAANETCTVSSQLTAENLVNWIRGEDNSGNEDPAGPCDGVADCNITIRPSIHGDVLHSRPAVINYGEDASGNPRVVVFYGGGDGVFHAVNGNQEGSIEGVRAGGELWGFIAPEFFDQFKRLYRNDPLVSIAGIQDENAEPKDHFFDGSPTILQDGRTGVATSGKKYLFLTARRGGRFIYAIDVTDIDTPKFLWRKSTGDIGEMGQTWAQPKIALLEGYVDDNAKGKPVLILPLGYDPAEDADPGPAANDSTFTNAMGRGVVILDAVTGDILWAAVPDCTGITLATGGACVDSSTTGQQVPTRAIAADPTLMDRNGDGFVDRVYLADVGANIFRINFETSSGNSPSNWEIYKKAQLGGTGNDMRKFLFPVDVVPASSTFDVILGVTGDREHPLFPDENGDGVADSDLGLAYNVRNRFYMLQDDNSKTTITESMLFANPQDKCFDANEDLISCDDANAVSQTSFGTLRGEEFGYFMDLVANTEGEKGVNAPLTVAGKTFFATNQPDTPSEGSCTANLGIARAYEIDFRSASLTTRLFSGGGMPPSPIAGLVTIGKNTIPFIIGGKGPSPFDPGEPDIDLSNKRNRAFWYYE